jgi:transcriptional regulator with GAF, ATPase, and Fis domain
MQIGTSRKDAVSSDTGGGARDTMTAHASCPAVRKLRRGAVVELVGISQALRDVDASINWAARSDAKILITGESGVGKEVVARLIHQRSGRGNLPLVTINCAGIPDSLLESELFGHVRGSFTNAFRDRRGLLELADRSTIFLDEVGEMTPRMQALLLRFLETGEIQRVGADRPETRVDVRVIAATNRDLLARIASNEFRQDVYYRLNVIPLEIPPLRQRAEDVPVLIRHFFQLYADRHKGSLPQLTADALAKLVAYQWPGNVRELKNVAERLILRSPAGTIDVPDLPLEIREVVPGVSDVPRDEPRATVDVLYERMVSGGESFWDVVYPMFMARDLTRDDLREIVERGLRHTGGHYTALGRLFGVTDNEYKRLLNFLRQHRCHVRFQRFRTLRPTAPREARAVRTGSESAPLSKASDRGVPKASDRPDSEAESDSAQLPKASDRGMPTADELSDAEERGKTGTEH